MEHPQTPRRCALRLAWILAAAALVLVLGLTATAWLNRASGGAAVAASQVDPSALEALDALERGFNWVAETIRPSVVFVEVERQVSAPERAPQMPQIPDFGLPDWWREFFGPGVDPPWRRQPRPEGPAPEPRIPMGQGSGVIFDPSGYILTNNHVVEGASQVTVHLADGASYPAKVVGADELSDLAVLKVEPDRPLRAAELGDAAEARVGSWVMAVGYPFGGTRYGGRFDEAMRYEPTVTVGIVSAKERQIASTRPGYPFRELIQTDAPINPGNSGGPLVNMRAQVIGINQAIFTSGPWSGNIGVGFAIPINARTKQIIDTLREGETVVRGRLGVGIMPLTPARAQVYGVDHGVFVENVEPDSPAARAGLQVDDVIVEYDGRRVTSRDEFVSWVQGTRPGTKVQIRVIRDGKAVSLEATIGALALRETASEPAAAERQKLGLTVVPLEEGEAEEMGLPGGVRVRSVDPLSDAARAGIRPGDVIVRVNRDAVTDLSSYQRSIAKLQKGDPVVIRFWREGQSATTEIPALSE